MLKGIDRTLEYGDLLSGIRIGLICSISSVNNDLISTIDILHKHFRLTALFGPEHGVRGDKAAGEQVEDYIDDATGVPVYSLYKSDSKRLTKEMLEQVDAVVYDLQDLGVRYYTFVSTLIYALEDCAKAGKQLIVLDRPNPLGGNIIEGDILKPEYQSFVGAYPLPVRYGLTPGELAIMVNEERKLGCDLVVIPCEGWSRDEIFTQTGQIWVMPSPGIPRFETALLYPGICLFEGTNISEGRGTSCPFEIIGAPFINAGRLVEKLRNRKLPGVNFTPAYFTPTSSKYSGVPCNGIHIHITDYYAFESYRTSLVLLETIRDLYPNDFKYLPFISLLSGGNIIENTYWTSDGILKENEEGLRKFREKKEKYHIYK
jgi:Protein of unknown function (DUF1343).